MVYVVLNEKDVKWTREKKSEIGGRLVNTKSYKGDQLCMH